MIDFLKYKKLYFLISALCIGVGIYSIATFGFRLAIDFTGGSVVEYQLKPAPEKAKIETLLRVQKIDVLSVDIEGERMLLRSSPIEEKQQADLQNQLKKDFKSVQMLRFETVGPIIGKEAIYKTIIASLVAGVGILLYITFAFRNVTYGLAAVLAVVHDILILLGAYSLVSRYLGAEVDTLFVTAVLTTMSFSVHDTIVVFDKIREYRRRDRTTPFENLGNRALTETMVRSLNNSLTIILMLTALILLGGDTIRFFIVALLIGTITGTYSSPFVAVPLLSFFESRRR